MGGRGVRERVLIRNHLTFEGWLLMTIEQMTLDKIYTLHSVCTEGIFIVW